MEQNQSISLKKDLIIALIIGEILAWLILILAKQILPTGLYTNFRLFIITLPIYFPILSAVSLYLAYLINKKITFIYQVAKFALIGGLNTLIDWGILALLILTFEQRLQIQSSQALVKILFITITFYTLYKAISFMVATVNSYLWNKFWTFTRKTKEQASKELAQFFVVSIVGFLINVGIASWVFIKILPIGGLNSSQWGILAAVIATATSMIWNFLGYKFIVFDSKKPDQIV